MSFDVLRTPLGILKILLSLVLLTIVLLAAFGNDGIRLTFGRADFLGVGISFCLAITLPLILIAYLCGGNLFVLEALLSVVGSPLLIYSGVVALQAYDHPELGSPAGNAMGGLSIAAGILLVINLLTIGVTLRSH